MRKYLFIFKSELMSNLQYIANIITGFIGYFIILFIFLNLWKFIYSDPSEIINGYSLNQMIWYVIITELLWSVLNGKHLERRISNDVKEGNIAYNINKPYNYILYCVFSHMGSCILRFLMYVVLCMLTGYLFLHTFPELSIISVLAVLLTGFFATIINTLLITFIGLFSFIIEDAHPFYWLYSKVILVLGTIFPIEYFPVIIQPILKFSPIYVVSYGPAKLFVDFSYTTFIQIIIAQIIYIFISYMICRLLYKKGVKNLNVNGG